METELLTVQQCEEIQPINRNPSPLSEEELKDFYLKLARMINPNACSSNRNDLEILGILRKDLKRNLGILCKYTQHAWDEGIQEIQMACGAYSVQDTMPKKERLEVNASLGKHLQFLAQMASQSSIVRRMHAEYTRHFINVEYLLRQMGVSKEA
ncbi:MAG: hypothetical protein ACK5N4_07370 [Parabacteroides gordonii]|uniref:hypothetical protein n=1 Tax=Parabacteroides gordonii TaxID=574930 RepID=UPI003A89EB84